MSRYLGIDLGTTGCKVSVLSDQGEQIASASREYLIRTPKYGWAEQDPVEWWKAVVDGCAEIEVQIAGTLGTIDAISLCGQMHTQVLLDADDRVIRPAITWMDQRASGIVDGMTSDTDIDSLIIGEAQNRLTSTYTAAHLSWIKQEEPETWRRVATVLVAKDYLKFVLTGERRIDFSEASGTLLFNNQSEQWSPELLRLFGVPETVLPRVGESTEVIGAVTADASRQTGIPQGVPVLNGSTDNSASALGGGMVAAGEAALIIGTAGVVSVCSDQARPDPQFRTLSWHYCLPKRWINLGVTQTAGESLNWFKKAFEGGREDATAGDIFAEYNREIEAIPEGSEGLTFLPYLNGERTPHWDAMARGVFFGIGLHHRKAHFIKAIMEGVSFALRDNIESVEELGVRVKSVRAVGGGLKSPVWRQTLARVLARPIELVERPDTGNIGNAILCAVGTGAFNSPEEAVAHLVSGASSLRADSKPELEERYRVYKGLYPALQPIYQITPR